MYKLLPLFLVALLAGCAMTPAERETRMQRELDQMIQAHGPMCDKLGYKRDTDPWRNCLRNQGPKDGGKNGGGGGGGGGGGAY